MITLKLLLWLIPIGLNIYADKDGRKPDYLMMFILRGLAAIIHAVSFDPRVGQDYFIIFIFQITSYWILFDLGLNIVRGREILYYDRKERDSGWIERFFDSMGPVFYLVAKVLALIACVLAIIAIYYRFG